VADTALESAADTEVFPAYWATWENNDSRHDWLGLYRRESR
jgi:hypothetical protein